MNLFSRRPRMVAVAAVTGVAALALAGWGLAPRTDAEGRALGPRMAISLVAPREPEITAGDVLEVGALSDGFDRASLDRAPEAEDPTWMPPEAYAGTDDGFIALPRMPPPRPVPEEDFSAPPPPPPPEDRRPLRDGSRWFGLDRMRADASAEREERRERRAAQDAMERRQYAERRDAYERSYWRDGPAPRDRYDDPDRMDRQEMERREMERREMERREMERRDRWNSRGPDDAPRASDPAPEYADRDDYSYD